MNLDKIRNIIRNLNEDMTVGTGGFSGSSDPSGPVAGYDKVMQPMRKRYAKGGKNSRKHWLEYLKGKK
jgi:hypothetical protein